MKLKCPVGEQIFLPPPCKQGVGGGEMRGRDGGGGGGGSGVEVSFSVATMLWYFFPAS